MDNKTELELADDAAYVNWGSNWRMPSNGQFGELINSSYTTTEWTTQNGVPGRKITSKKNGNSIFLPAAGARSDSSLNFASTNGSYWSRTLKTINTIGAFTLAFFRVISSQITVESPTGPTAEVFVLCETQNREPTHRAGESYSRIIIL